MPRVLVVDDSAFMRKALTRMLEADPSIQVVGTARDGLDALTKIETLDPDLVTLDVEMPRMDGLEALGRIMATSPRPVLMVSSLTAEGAETTLRALDLGALDFIPKDLGRNVLDIVQIQETLREKVRVLARRKSPEAVTTATPRVSRTHPPVYLHSQGKTCCVAIGASTGGPPVLQRIFAALPADFSTPVVVVQHMPKAFTGPFARRLGKAGPLDVKEAETGDRLEPGRGFVAPGGRHLRVKRERDGYALQISDRPVESLYRPSVDVAFTSFAEIVGAGVLAVMLTGMGHDGVEGVRALKERGARTIAQNEETCVVYGMPKAVVVAGLADEVLPADAIGPSIGEAVS